MSVEEIDVWIRLAVLVGGGIGALWLTVRGLWRLQAEVERRFEGLLVRRGADVDRLQAELDAERKSCQAQLDALSRRIEAQDRKINELLGR